MHEIPIPQPRIIFLPNLPFVSRRSLLRYEPSSPVIDQILEDRACLRKYEGLLPTGNFDDDDGGFAEGMHVLQFGGREPVLATLEGSDLVGEFELL